MPALQTIDKEGLKRKIQAEEDFQLINVLSPKSYGLGFIKGSMKIPVSELDDREDEIDKDKEVVVYCASYECDASKNAAEKLSSKGYDVKAYEGGIKEWKESGYPSE